jgi:hypothetical protein
MQVLENGSVTFTSEERAAIAKVLCLGRRVAEHLGAGASDACETAPEVELLETIDFLDDVLGVSADELTEGLETRTRPV